MTLPVSAANAVAWWAGYYGDHQLVSVTVRYLHFASLVIGGGAAITFDQFLRRARRGGDSARALGLELLASSHRIVVPNLVLIVATGILMTAADLDTYVESRVFWLKMALFALLIVNGAVLMSGERLAMRDAHKAWHRLGITSRVSQVLWLVIVLVSCWLVVAA